RGVRRCDPEPPADVYARRVEAERRPDDLLDDGPELRRRGRRLRDRRHELDRRGAADVAALVHPDEDRGGDAGPDEQDGGPPGGEPPPSRHVSSGLRPLAIASIVSFESESSSVFTTQ